VICGHIHWPIIAKHETPEAHSVSYMNSGDWVENLLALEMRDREWRIFKYETSGLHLGQGEKVVENIPSAPLPETLRKKIFNPGDILHLWF